jgi:hypothetical protein
MGAVKFLILNRNYTDIYWYIKQDYSVIMMELRLCYASIT